MLGLGAAAAWKASFGPDSPRGFPYVEILAGLGLYLGWLAALPAAVRAALAYRNSGRSKAVLLALLAAGTYFLVGLAIPAFSTGKMGQSHFSHVSDSRAVRATCVGQLQARHPP